MLTFLIFGALAIAVFGVAAIPFMLIGLLFKLIVLPFRLFFFLLGGAFRLVFGLLGGLLGLIVGPIMLLIVGVALLGALVAGIFSLLAPMIPMVLLGLLVWAIYRVVRRPTPAF
jgi:hypothetical protein